MKVILMLWDMLSLTGVNSLLTLLSILISLFAAYYAYRTKNLVNKYNRGLQCYEFLALSRDFKDLNKQTSQSISEKNASNWNRAGKNAKILEMALDLTIELNQHYCLIQQEKRVGELEELVENVRKIVRILKGNTTYDNLTKFSSYIDSIDRILAEESIAIREHLMMKIRE